MRCIFTQKSIIMYDQHVDFIIHFVIWIPIFIQKNSVTSHLQNWASWTFSGLGRDTQPSPRRGAWFKLQCYWGEWLLIVTGGELVARFLIFGHAQVPTAEQNIMKNKVSLHQMKIGASDASTNLKNRCFVVSCTLVPGSWIWVPVIVSYSTMYLQSNKLVTCNLS
jgi:hypothetical protein